MSQSKHNLTDAEKAFFFHILANSGNGVTDLAGAEYLQCDNYSCFKAQDLICGGYSRQQVGGFMSSLDSKGLIIFDEEVNNPLWWITTEGVELAVEMFQQKPKPQAAVSFRDKFTNSSIAYGDKRLERVYEWVTYRGVDYPVRNIGGTLVSINVAHAALMNDDGSDWRDGEAYEIESDISYYVPEDELLGVDVAVIAYIINHIDAEAEFPELAKHAVYVTYTATYGETRYVYAADEEDAIDVAQRTSGRADADSLVSNCECDYEHDGVVAEEVA